MNTKIKGQFYRGRFAPSPSGPLHFGSLTSALASYLDAKANNGEWLVRIEDIDPPREVEGSDKLILDSLVAHGMQWDKDILYQSSRSQAYEEALIQLASGALIFYCSCTNKLLKKYREKSSVGESILANGVYPGICREHSRYQSECSLRLKISNQIFLFHDAVYGLISQDLNTEVGDFILKRRDGLYAYQLAVVIDDIYQGITDIVRGVDLLDSTPRQLYLYQCLNAQAPNYKHLPLALLPDGKKLSKQTGAKALDNAKAAQNIFAALQFLGQAPPDELLSESVENLIKWGVKHWHISKITTQDTVI